MLTRREPPHSLIPVLVATIVLLGLATVLQGAPASQPAVVEGLFISPVLSLDPPHGLLVDAWYKLELLDQPVGYMRSAIRRQGDRIETLDYTLIQVARGPVTIKVVMKSVTAETLTGEPLEMHTEQVFANNPVRYDATFRPDNSIDLRITQDGNKMVRDLPADPTATYPWQMVREILLEKRKPGESFRERGYAFVADTKPMTVEHKAAGEATLKLPDGREVRTYLYKVTNPAMGGEGDVYCEGQILMPLRFDMPVMGMRFVATIATREQAMAPAGKPTELFISTMLKAKVTGPLDPAQAGSVLYTMQLPDETGVTLVATGMQRTVSQKGRVLEVLVSRRKPSPARPAGATSQVDLEKYLATTTYCNIDDEAVRKLAIEGAGEEKDPQRLAETLTRYVYQKMTHKGLDVAFATASEAARTLKGDCTEHATLLAALARANGLPARGVFGMVGLPGSYADGELTYGYHMWTQVYAGGRWIDIDAALNQPIPDATHIALGLSDLADTSLPTESIQTFMQIAGKVRLTAEPRK
jgi:hypothetical protein